MSDPGLAAADRRRLEQLLGVDADQGLRPSAVEKVLPPGAEWSAAFVDAVAGINLVAYFIGDPDEREEAARAAKGKAVAGDTVCVASNGGLLLVATAKSDEPSTAERMVELLSRFAGEE
ncbi:MAG TPA: hypothetical protein VME46_20450 [Acidimicrobiales bacterium]|nr:hypothetical protein [Acidimicrobiales bacterium]